MSVRYEGAGAESIAITVHHPGEELGDDTVPPGDLALALNYDEVFIIQGTPHQLRVLLAEAINKVNEAEYHEEEA